MEGTVIFGGDSNVAFDQGLDKSKPPGTQMTRPTKVNLKIAKPIHAQSMADVKRELNPSTQDFTHYSNPHNSYARIDHLLVPTYIIPFIVKSHIKDTDLSDHSIVMMSIHLQSPKTGQRHWGLNESILSDPIRVSMIDKSLQEYFHF